MKTPLYILGSAAALLITSGGAMAQDNYVSCEPTRSLYDQSTYPAEISNNNNLRRKPGGSYFAKGDPIVVTGRILDEHCTPVTGATVEFWQADSEGNYETDDPYFSNSGKTTTNNLGEYYFLTVFPGRASERQASNVNFKIIHPELDTHYTRIYLLREEPVGAKKDSGKTLNAIKRIEEGEEVYLYNITLQGNLPHRGF